MVKGFELFKERFSEFGESFIVIGVLTYFSWMLFGRERFKNA